MIQAKNVHIIGLGGIGTSAVARLFLEQGARVSGSDMHVNSIIEDLKREGVDFRLGHFSENIPRECDLVIYSRAIPATNVERQIASEQGMTIMSYPEFIGEIAKTKKTIAVSGTNGKSTTTAMIASILIEAGLDPLVIVGTQVPGWPKHNLHAGKGEWFVVEACEHLASFLNVKPDVAVITNITEDHLDYYRDLDHICETFNKWIAGVKSGGACVVNVGHDHCELQATASMIRFAVQDRKIENTGQKFIVEDEVFDLLIPGEFNAENGAAAIMTAKCLGVSSEVCAKALKNFKGTWRRFERVGLWKGADIYSDYAHHPDAIEGTIEAFKEAYPKRRLVVVFEPHQRSRTKELFEEFVGAFDGVDELVLAEIYEVEGRDEGDDISSQQLVDRIKDRNVIDNVFFAPDYKAIEDYLRDHIKPGDLLIFMGAGTIDNLARKLV